MCKKRDSQAPAIPEELIEELRQEMAHPSDPTVPDLPEIPAPEEGDVMVVQKKRDRRCGSG